MRGRSTTGGDEFVREVDEAVRQDQWLKLWRRYGTWLIAAAATIVVGSALGVGWREYRASQRLDEARAYAAAEQQLRTGQPAAAAKAFAELAEDAHDGFGVLARLRAAEAQAAAKDPAAAAASLAALATGSGVPAPYADLAKLMALQQRFDQTDPQTMLRELEPILASDGPWRQSALELKALAQLKMEDVAAARSTLAELTGQPNLPQALARRASTLLASLGPAPGAGTEPAKPAAGNAPAPAATSANPAVPAADAGVPAGQATN